MKMFVANCTQQHQDFLYRVPESTSPRLARIDIGAQVQLSGELTQQQIDSIIAQHAKYGLVRADEVDRTRPFIGLCYTIDRPVNINAMKAAVEHNRGVLDARGKKIREEAAIATQNQMAQNDPGLKAIEATIVEDRKDGGTPEVNETYRVDPNAAANRTVGRRRPRRRASDE
jgi:hypothetical protein